MTREEAIKVLAMFLHKQCDLERTKFAYDANTVWDAVYMASEALEQEPKWIPVSERLPEERGVYIVTEKVFSVDDRKHQGRYNTRVEQVEYYDGKWQRASFFEVTAWMPLPAPYKVDSKE